MFHCTRSIYIKYTTKLECIRGLQRSGLEVAQGRPGRRREEQQHHAHRAVAKQGAELSLWRTYRSTRFSLPVSYVLREQVKYVAGRVDYVCHVDRDEVRFELEHRELGSVENLVAKLSISFHARLISRPVCKLEQRFFRPKI